MQIWDTRAVSHCTWTGLQCDLFFCRSNTTAHLEGVSYIMSTKYHRNIRSLCEGAIFIAFAQILSYIRLLPNLPNGGSITLAMFPIILFSVRWGVGKGLCAGFIYGLLQMIFDGAYAWGWQSMLLDYLVAFTPLGFAGLCKGKSWGIFPGTVIACISRFAVHFISGITIYKILVPTEVPGIGTFDDPTIYSLVYNGSYLLPSMVLVLIAAAVLYVPLKRYYAGRDIL